MSHKHRKKPRRRRRTRRKKASNEEWIQYKKPTGLNKFGRARKQQKRMKPCGKYYKGEYGIDKRCKKDKNCRYIDMGSGGEWCYPVKKVRQKTLKRRKKKSNSKKHS